MLFEKPATFKTHLGNGEPNSRRCRGVFSQDRMSQVGPYQADHDLRSLLSGQHVLWVGEPRAVWQPPSCKVPRPHACMNAHSQRLPRCAGTC